MLGIPMDTLFTITNVGYLLSLGLTLFLSVALWRVSTLSQADKDVQLEHYKTDAAVKIADANTVAATARQEAAEANKAAAIANAQAEAARQLAAEAQAATASAMLATEELRRQTTGRTMPDDQIQEIAQALKNSGIHLNIECPFGDPEAAIYAAHINIMLSHEGVDVGKVNMRSDGMFFGIALSGPNDTYTQVIRKSFEDRGTNVRYTEGPIYSLYIGNRLPPFVQQ